MNSKLEAQQLKPWYKEPWPWVAIAIPGAAVIMGITTLILAINNPDPVIIDDKTYQELHSSLKAQQTSEVEEAAPASQDDGDH